VVLWSRSPVVPWSCGPVVLWTCGLWSCSPVVLWSRGPVVPWSRGPWSSGLEGLELLLQLLRHEWLDQRIEVALEQVLQVVEGQVETMIGHAILREVVGADLFAAFARANLRAALAVVLGFFLGNLRLEEARPQHG